MEVLNKQCMYDYYTTQNTQITCTQNIYTKTLHKTSIMLCAVVCGCTGNPFEPIATMYHSQKSNIILI